MKKPQLKALLPAIAASSLAFASWSTTARAQTCQAGTPQEDLMYLRRLSLDLRGRMPALEELEATLAGGGVAPAVIDEMLASEEFIEQIVGVHRDMLWTNITDTRLAQNNWRLRGPNQRYNDMPAPAYWMGANQRAGRYRGAQVPCLDEPARFDADGNILTTPDSGNPNIRREGWVEVTPYWNPAITVRVCAFDAQDNLQGPDAQGRMIDCSVNPNSTKCGCGPNLSWCESNADQTRLKILSSMNDQLLRFVADVVRSGRPYTDVLLGKDMEINGPISHWLRYQTQTGGQGDGSLIARPQQNHPLPEIAFSEIDNWQRIERGARHSGVLSMPGYLIKFQSDRGRANRFYNAFLCQHFEASNPLPPATDACHQEADLTKRCGCKDCHVAVEPAAAYWGRWAEAGLMPMNNELFPKFNSCCVEGGSCTPDQRRTYTTNFCARFYYTDRDLTGRNDPTASFVGTLKPYVFADAARETNIAEGPEGIARKAIESGQFASCTVRRMWTRLLAREPALDEQATLDELTASFQTDYDLRRLLKDIVTRPEYEQAGRYVATSQGGTQ